jgi:DNA-binding CsgD family transcriptional regulator
MRFGGEEVYVARRAHIARQAKIAALSAKGLSPKEISAKLGVTRQPVHNARKSSAIL